jgi:hypothetical protein
MDKGSDKAQLVGFGHCWAKSPPESLKIRGRDPAVACSQGAAGRRAQLRNVASPGTVRPSQPVSAASIAGLQGRVWAWLWPKQHAIANCVRISGGSASKRRSSRTKSTPSLTVPGPPETNVQPHPKVTTRLCFGNCCGNSAWSSTLNRI